MPSADCRQRHVCGNQHAGPWPRIPSVWIQRKICDWPALLCCPSHLTACKSGEILTWSLVEADGMILTGNSLVNQFAHDQPAKNNRTTALPSAAQEAGREPPER